MGMAASQARLLTLTARLHDVEHAAQSIQHAKLQLATQQDDAYDAYQRALDATSLTFLTMDSSGRQSNVVANYNNLFALNGANASGHNYALIDARGRVIVSADLEQKYNAFLDAGYPLTANAFALYALYGNGFQNATEGEPYDFMTAAQTMLTTAIQEGDTELERLLEETGCATLQDVYSGGDSEAIRNFLSYFFNHYGNRIFNNEDIPEERLDEYNYYFRMFNAIQQHGGCISITDFDGPDGSAATNSEWLTAMLQSGQFTIELFSKDNQSLSGTSVADDTVLSYTTTTQIDKVALAKAEADYEHELKKIDRKDKKFDMDLSKLEAERSALTKQYDSLKKVVDDNIERTFGIFS